MLPCLWRSRSPPGWLLLVTKEPGLRLSSQYQLPQEVSGLCVSCTPIWSSQGPGEAGTVSVLILKEVSCVWLIQCCLASRYRPLIWAVWLTLMPSTRLLSGFPWLFWLIIFVDIILGIEEYLKEI